MEKRIQILVGFSARRNIGDFCHPRGSKVDERSAISKWTVIKTRRVKCIAKEGYFILA